MRLAAQVHCLSVTRLASELPLYCSQFAIYSSAFEGSTGKAPGLSTLEMVAVGQRRQLQVDMVG